MWWFPSPAGNSLPEVFCICFFHAASHWRCAHSHPAVGWDRQAFLHICTFLLMLSQFTAEVLFIIPQVHALTLHAFELLPIPTTPVLKVIQHFPCNVPAFLTIDAIQISVSSKFQGTVTWNEGCESQVPNTVLGECLSEHQYCSLFSLLVIFV